MTEKSEIGSTGRPASKAEAVSDPDDATIVARWRATTGERAPASDALAAFAEHRLSRDEAAEIEAWLAANPTARADVDAARQAGAAPLPQADDTTITRALALVGGAATAARPNSGPAAAWSDARVVPFRRARDRSSSPARLPVSEVLRWAAMAASIALVSFVGFELGSDAYVSFATLDPAVASRLHGDILFEPTTGFFGGLGEASAT